MKANKPKGGLDPELNSYLDQVAKVCSSRAAKVIEHIRKEGRIDAQDLQELGFIHGARAIGDVRDNGVPLKTLKTKSPSGRSIASYVFGNASEIRRHKLGGRRPLPAKLRNELAKKDGVHCKLSGEELPLSELQIDHRVPFNGAGDNKKRSLDDYMLLSRPMQRSKSWACEHCDNLKKDFRADICATCYWASPENYSHVAMKPERRLDVTFVAEDAAIYESLSKMADARNVSSQQIVKEALEKYVTRERLKK